MLTVLMECRDNEPELAHTLAVLVAGAVDGLVSDVIVLDHGSRDGSARVADAAGCRFVVDNWELGDVLRMARGDWIMLLEPGARPERGWVEDVVEHVSLSRAPARFAPSSRFRRPFFRRWKRSGALEHGFLMPKREAAALARPGMGLSALAKASSARKLRSELIPAWVMRENR